MQTKRFATDRRDRHWYWQLRGLANHSPRYIDVRQPKHGNEVVDEAEAVETVGLDASGLCSATVLYDSRLRISWVY